MATTIETHKLPEDTDKRVSASESFSAPGATDWVKLYGVVAVQITGDATAVTAQVQRSTENPDGTANPAPAGDAITGDLTDGVQPVAYDEPGAAWWRVDVSTVTGGDALVNLSGQGW